MPFFNEFGRDGQRTGVLVGVHWLCRESPEWEVGPAPVPPWARNLASPSPGFLIRTEVSTSEAIRGMENTKPRLADGECSTVTAVNKT